MCQVVMARHLEFVCVEHPEGITIYMPSLYKGWDISPFTIMYRVVKYFVKLPVKYTGGDSSVDMATIRRSGSSADRIPVGARFSAPVQTDPEAHPTSCTIGIESYPRVNRPGRHVDHPHRGQRKNRAIPVLFY
jgi:hypothetical protein